MKREVAIQELRGFIGQLTEGCQEAIKVLIPELEESEDEKIRKFLVELVSNDKANNFRGFYDIRKIDFDNVLAWLEKQKESPKSADSIPLDCVSDAKCENRWHKVGDSLPDSVREVICKDAIGNFFIGRYYKGSDSWEVSMYDDVDKSNEDNPPVVMWCDIPSEKQKEPENVSASTMIPSWWTEEPSLQKEQKPANEPKFKVGDWIIFAENHNSVYQVERIDKYRYYLRHYLGGTLSAHFDNELVRQWTIQDAKPGDVLVCIGKYGQEIGIVKEYVGKYGGCDKCFETYCFVDWEGIFRTGEYMGSKEIHPATKEQRNTLMKAMADNGYTFDFENKNLNKKEQKPITINQDEKEFLADEITAFLCNYDKEFDGEDPVPSEVAEHFYLLGKQAQKPVEWSDTDNIGWDEAFACVTRAEKAAKNEEELQNAVTAEKWLKEIKFKYCVHPVNQEWSEEDENKLNHILEIVHIASGSEASVDEKEELESFLKSLRPQPHWKPSEEQMWALSETIAFAPDTFKPKCTLMTLQNDLKKL